MNHSSDAPQAPTKGDIGQFAVVNVLAHGFFLFTKDLSRFT
ncbi:MAG TPA: hypothetical protein VKB16_15250 [Beijerinckiaceae bacterium]|nr:hypothetical protein [Beijerinckiaceae bacterium]